MDKQIKGGFFKSRTTSKAINILSYIFIYCCINSCDIRFISLEPTTPTSDTIFVVEQIPLTPVVVETRSQEEINRECIVKTYRSYDGIVERTGKNDHPKIDYFHSLLKPSPPLGSAWCGSMAHAAFYECGVPTQINAWSPTGHNPKNLVYFKNEFIKEPKLADVTTFYNINKKRIDHVGFWDGDIDKDKYYSFEGNYSNRSGRVIRSYKLTYSISRHL